MLSKKFLDCDVLLSHEDTLMELVELNLPVVAPMLLSDALYSNFWGGMYDDYYYQRTEEYKDILHYKKIGQFRVPMVHTAVLVKLNTFSSDSITFEKSKIKDLQGLRPIPLDDIIIFAVSCNSSGNLIFYFLKFIFRLVSIFICFKNLVTDASFKKNMFSELFSSKINNLNSTTFNESEKR